MPPVVTLEDRKIPLREGESVLDALEREGVAMLSSCRSGICQSCLVKAIDGEVPPQARKGLKDSLSAQGYFLSCVCYPQTDLGISLPGEALDHAARVIETHDIGAAVRRVRLSVPQGFTWFAGQYITLIRQDGIARSYSVASSPEDKYLELHIRRIPNGALSNWLHDDVRSGSEIRLRGPFGDCFYTGGDLDAPLWLAGTGTGLAPLYGIVRDALRAGHRGRITLYHGALNTGGLYHQNELTWLAQKSHNRFRYHPCVMDGTELTPTSRIIIGALDEIVLSQDIDLKQSRAYLCGDPVLVDRMRKKLFLKGLSSRRIFADAFVPTKPTPPPGNT